MCYLVNRFVSGMTDTVQVFQLTDETPEQDQTDNSGFYCETHEKEVLNTQHFLLQAVSQ